MKAKFMFSLICVAVVTLTACEEYPYGYYSHGSSPYGSYSPYGYSGYGGGYSITLNERGKIIRTITAVRSKMKICTRVSDGEFGSEIL